MGSILGIDEEEADSIQPLSDSSIPRKGALPKDFQDALSIIFDKGTVSEPVMEQPKESSPQPEISIPDPATYVAHSYATMVETDPSQLAPAVEIDERSQFAMYGSMTDQPLVFNEMTTILQPPPPLIVPPPAAITIPAPLAKTKISIKTSDVLPENIPTPPIQILDANGKLMKIPTSNVNISDYPMSDGEEDTSASDKLKASSRMMDLDDLAMLGIDADDLAAQCI